MTFTLRTQQTALTTLLRLPEYAFLRAQDPFDHNLWVAGGGGRIDPPAWNALSPAAQQAAFDKAVAAAANDINGLAVLVLDDAQRAPANDEQGIGLAVINQWKQGAGNIAPISRVILAIAEVGLEYVSIDPSILGMRGSRGEKILKSFATSLATPVSAALDTATLGPASQFF